MLLKFDKRQFVREHFKIYQNGKNISFLEEEKFQVAHLSHVAVIGIPFWTPTRNRRLFSTPRQFSLFSSIFLSIIEKVGLNSPGRKYVQSCPPPQKSIRETIKSFVCYSNISLFSAMWPLSVLVGADIQHIQLHCRCTFPRLINEHRLSRAQLCEMHNEQRKH